MAALWSACARSRVLRPVTCRAKGTKGPTPVQVRRENYQQKMTSLKERGANVYDVGPEILGEGSFGAEVTELQKYLDRDGYYQYEEYTGYFGPLTKQAVMRWQVEQGITPTGNFGVKSLARYWELMEEGLTAKREEEKGADENQGWMRGIGKDTTTSGQAVGPANSASNLLPKRWPIGIAVVAVVAVLVPRIYLKIQEIREVRLAEAEQREEDRLRQLNRWNATINVDRLGGPGPSVPSRKSISDIGRESSSYDNEDVSGSF